MSYQVLARKYRPQVFEDVLGQAPVIQTLANALSTKRVAHAILFTGPRGTGKTSIARILAKALNCMKAPTPVPCNDCRSCLDITKGYSADVFEIDGASNNSVDQVRELRENAVYRPSLGSYKIYIIDEVHMLSTAAFNALLKILEEPPAHVIFIFATTEVHKLPATILSRCQRHDLSRVSLPVLVNHLQSLCDSEGFAILPEVIEHIAIEADGSVRDSLSLLDRILSAFPEGATQLDLVMESLGIADQKLMQDLSLAIIDKNGAKILALIEKIDNAGLDLKRFYVQVISHFRDMYVIKITGTGHDSINAANARKKSLAKMVEPLSPEYLSLLLELLLAQENLVRFSSCTKIALETIFLKMLRIRQNADLDEIISQLDILVKFVGKQENSTFSAQENNIGGESSSFAGRDKSLTDLTEKFASMDTEKCGSDLVEADQLSPEQENYSVLSADYEKPVEDIKEKDFQVAEPETFSWRDFLDKVQKTMPLVAGIFSKANVDENHHGDKIIVSINHCSDFERKRLKDKTSHLQQMCKSILGKNLEMNLSDKASQLSQPKKSFLRVDLESHPLLEDARRIFHGTIIY